MYLTGKHIPRRAVLKGLGVSIALPFLDAMRPAASALTAAAGARKLRLVAMEMVHGVAGATDLRREEEHVVAGRRRIGVRPVARPRWRRSSRIATT